MESNLSWKIQLPQHVYLRAKSESAMWNQSCTTRSMLTDCLSRVDWGEASNCCFYRGWPGQVVVKTWASCDQLSRESQDDQQAKDGGTLIVRPKHVRLFDIWFRIYLIFRIFFLQREIRDVFLSLDKQTIKQNNAFQIDTCIMHFDCVCFQYLMIVVLCNLQWRPKYKIKWMFGKIHF